MKTRKGPSGLHLFNRNSGINLLLDEIDVPKKYWDLAPRQITIALTNKCDLSCPHCYAPKKSAVLKYEQVLSWLEELDKNGCLGVGFGGGEPTLYKNFSELCSLASEKTDMAITFTTHGHNLSEELLENLSSNVHFIRVSMDGVGDTYEGIRGRSFSTLLENIILMSEYVPFGINFLVNKKTIDELEQVTEIASELGASEVLILPEEPIRQGSGIGSEVLEDLKKWVWNYSGTIPLSISDRYSKGFPFCDPKPEESDLQTYAHVDASEVLKPTSFHHKGIKIEGSIIKSLEKLKSVYEYKEA